MRNVFVVILLIQMLTFRTYAQSDSTTAIAEIKKFQDELNSEYRNPKESPLDPAEVKKFKGHSFFTADLKFRVIATLTTTPGTPFFKMKTSSGKTAEYRQYGLVGFTLSGSQYQLPIYQSLNLMKTAEYKDYLFLPFTDLTNGDETYSAGRYLGLRIPVQSDVLVIDFNQAYNPYCAYSNNYSCPIVPSENNLDIKIQAGVRFHAYK